MSDRYDLRLARVLLFGSLVVSFVPAASLHAQDATRCLQVRSDKNGTYLYNGCNTKVGAFWCYPNQNHGYHCRDGGSGGALWTIGPGKGYPLEELDSGGRVEYAGCVSPESPTDIKVSSSGLRYRCK
jgi:hypothetical protein